MDRITAFNLALTQALLTETLKAGMTELCGLGVTLTIKRKDLGWRVDYKQPEHGPQLAPEEALIMACSVIWGPAHDDIMTDTIGQYIPDDYVQHVFEDLAQGPTQTPPAFRLRAYRTALHYIQHYEAQHPTQPLLSKEP